MRALRISCIFLLLSMQPARAGADVTLPATAKEDYASQVRVAGGVLIGLAIGPLSGKADPEDLRVPLTGLPERTPMCLTASTRDGQYWGEVTFTAPAKTTGLGKLDPQPQWRFRKQLERYERAKFAAVARYGPKCETDPSAEYLPVVYDGPRTTLTAAINSQRAIASAAQLLVPHKAPITGRCEDVEPDVHATAFDLVCRFDLGNAETGPATLRLHRHQRTGERTDEFAIRLP